MDSERRLREDLAFLERRFADERFCTDLYRALAGARWSHADAEAPVVLSWSRAEELVNSLRARFGHPPLDLAQGGAEGEVSRTVADELGTLGWRSEPRRTDADDPLHRASEEPASGTRAGAGWEEQARQDADAEIARRRGIG